MRQVLKILALDGDISEWFEYDGDPYRFRMDVQLEQRGLSEEAFNGLVALIHEYKNVRSKLEMLTFWLINQSQIPIIASVVQGGEITTILPRMVELVEQTQFVSVAVGCWCIEFITVYPEE